MKTMFEPLKEADTNQARKVSNQIITQMAEFKEEYNQGLTVYNS